MGGIFAARYFLFCGFCIFMRNVFVNHFHKLVNRNKHNILVKLAYEICKVFNAYCPGVNVDNAVAVD